MLLDWVKNKGVCGNRVLRLEGLEMEGKSWREISEVNLPDVVIDCKEQRSGGVLSFSLLGGLSCYLSR